MIVQKIGTRSTVFTFATAEWNLNLHLIEADKYNYIIDTGLGSDSVRPVINYIKNRKPIVVINTHYHWDHVWGNWVFKDSLIVSHSLCREITERKWDGMIEKNRRYISGEARMLLPNITFNRDLRFEEDGISLVFTPGHTEDSISVFDEQDRVLNAGDNIGDTPEEIVPNLECPKEEYIRTLKIYEDMRFKSCVSGHNGVMGPDVVERIMDKLR